MITATQQTARQRLSAIRNALALADDLLAQAYAARDWEALGHASWGAYCAAELPELRMIKLRAPERRARVAALAGAGATVRDIAAATGASLGTVHNDLAPAPGAGTPGQAPSKVAHTLALLESGPLTVHQLVRKTRWSQAQASAVLCRLHTAGRIGYLPPAKRGGTGVYTR